MEKMYEYTGISRITYQEFLFKVSPFYLVDIFIIVIKVIFGKLEIYKIN